MSSSENKQLLQEIFSEMSKGNTQPFIESLADEPAQPNGRKHTTG